MGQDTSRLFFVEKVILPETIHRLAARRTKKQGYKTADITHRPNSL
jgi:hypothetical protein